LKLELNTTPAQFNSLQDEWNALVPRSAINEIFLTWQWQTTWWQAYHPGDLWIVTAHDDAGNLVGVAPWFVERDSRIVRTIGCTEVTDYLDVLCSPDARPTFYAALADFLIQHAADYSHVNLCNIPEDSPTFEMLPRSLSERGFAVEIKQEDVCPYITLPGDWDQYLERLDKKNRHELRRKLRRAENSRDQGEAVDWYFVGPEHDLMAEIDRFLSLMAASHPNKAKFLENPGHQAFFRSIIPLVADCGWLQLSFLTVNGNAVATYLNFDYDNRILVYNSGLLPETYAYLSPGIVLLCYNIQHAIARHRSEFDFLQGNEEYKYRMGGQDRAVKMLEASRTT